MRRQRITLDELASRDNLMLATWKAARGKRHRPSVARFLRTLDANVEALQEAIRSGRAPDGRSHSFVIHDPKRRTITAACFRDRVLHHAILNLAEQRFEQLLIGTSFACRPGMGVHAAVEVVQRNVRRHPNWPWVVQVDIDGYFPSIDHAVLKALLARLFKGSAFLALLGRIIDLGCPGAPGRGLPIGSLTSQHFANAYLDGADRFLLGHRDVRAHVRYMDDIVWWCESRSAALNTLGGLKEYLLHQRRLRIKPSFHIGPNARGILFCGFRVRPGVILASSRKLKGYRRACRRVEQALSEGKASELQVQRALDGALATLARCETSGFRRRLHQASNAGE